MDGATPVLGEALTDDVDDDDGVTLDIFFGFITELFRALLLILEAIGFRAGLGATEVGVTPATTEVDTLSSSAMSSPFSDSLGGITTISCVVLGDGGHRLRTS